MGLPIRREQLHNPWIRSTGYREKRKTNRSCSPSIGNLSKKRKQTEQMIPKNSGLLMKCGIWTLPYKNTQFLLKREGLIIFSDQEPTVPHYAMRQVYFHRQNSISNGITFFQLFIYLFIHFLATQGAFHALEPQRSIVLLFCFCFCFFPTKEDKNVANLAYLTTQICSHTVLYLSFFPARGDENVTYITCHTGLNATQVLIAPKTTTSQVCFVAGLFVI